MKKIIFIILIIFSSCKTAKIPEPIIIEKKIIDTTYIESKLFEKQMISQGIFDSMFLKVHELQTANDSFNIECNKEIDRILKDINFKKKSGDNSYSIVYNQLKKQIEITAEMQELINKQDSLYFKVEKNKIEYREVPVDRPVYTNILTKWQKILIFLGVAFSSFYLFRIIRNLFF